MLRLALSTAIFWMLGSLLLVGTVMQRGSLGWDGALQISG
jgi:hypothetical protein